MKEAERKKKFNEFLRLSQEGILGYYDFLDFKELITHVNCHGHARRGFKDALGNDEKRAHWMLDMYKKLFAVEASAAENKFSAENRLQLRLEKSKPIIDEMKLWLDKAVLEVLPKNLIGKAIGYMLSRWDALTVFLKDGRV